MTPVTVRFYAPVHAETVDAYRGTRRLVRSIWAHTEDGMTAAMPGTVYAPVAGGIDELGRSYIDAEIRGAE